jgi:formate dehydrogenase major subunit
VPGLGTSFGRGGATTALPDLMNADAVLIMGSNMAENHPVGFQWVMEAKERGAKIIHVDPRFSRTSSVADIWAPLRAGSDILFLGGLVNYVLQNGKEFREYVVNYTNAPIIISEGFKDTEELDGVFSGWDPEQKIYDPQTWAYAHCGPQPNGEEQFAHGGHVKDCGQMAGPDLSSCERDDTLQNPNCVYQILKRHFARYTPEMVERSCGVPQKLFLEIAETFCSASGPEKTAAVCYALGWTQHSDGVQIIRTAAILQLLLGNIGRPGGGIMALRGHASIQGSTDIPTLYDILPGYLPMPRLGVNSHDLPTYLSKHRDKTGWWWNIDKYIVSLLKAYYGEAATEQNDWGFSWLPRVTGDHSHQGYFLDMADGKMEGLFVMGQNPAVAGPNSRLERKALAKLKWLVVRDLVEHETASFWYDSPEIERGELRTEEIGTEVFLFPAAGHAEKGGCFTNTQRLIQWHEKAVDPPGDARSEPWFMYHLGRRLKEKARLDPRPRNAGLNALTWDYSVQGKHEEPSVEEVLQEINGHHLTDHTLVSGFGDLKADGSTSCGCWIYSGIFPAAGRNRANERQPHDFYGHGWAFSWPADRRILYNRASARPDGKPWSERKKLVWWDETEKKWTGLDVPDFTATKPPDYKPVPGAQGDAALAGDRPFLLHPDGLGWIWVPAGLADGPLPTHYEPLESPVRNPLYAQQTNPPAMAKQRPDNRYAASPDNRFPYVMTTYRLTEHHTSGAMSRTLSHLAELQPDPFCEISRELAAERGIKNGDWVTITSMRGIVEVRALVTSRMQPLDIDGKRIQQVGVPYHWGYRGLVKGDVANDLVAISEEPNVRISEKKVLLCNVVSGHRAPGKEGLEQWAAQIQEPQSELLSPSGTENGGHL